MEPDTIVARATPPGIGAVALVRLSGPRAMEIVSGLLGPDQRPPGERTAALRSLTDPESGEPLDRSVVLYFPGPASYTGEDVVEISTHGGTLVPDGVVEACVRAGARRAEAGEFTQRAYLNGKLDLVQAEAVHDLIEGRSPVARRTALHQMEGGLSRRVAEIRDGLVSLEALLVHHLDFPDEDDPPVPVSELRDRGMELAGRLEALRRTAPEGMLLREGALVVLAGPPNAGKSSLFNALVGTERAIVTAVPGTTRDAIEAPLSIGGFPFRLVDTAGIRGDAGEIEQMGIEVARRYLEGAQLVLYCHRAAEPWGPDERAMLQELGPERTVVLATCIDEAEGTAAEQEGAGAGPPGTEELRVSVYDGTGLDALRRRLEERAFGGLRGLADDGGVVTRARQLRSIETALTEIGAFARGLDEGVPVEFAATHLRPAETALEELLGIIDPEEVLDRVFREFCVGK